MRYLVVPPGQMCSRLLHNFGVRPGLGKRPHVREKGGWERTVPLTKTALRDGLQAAHHLAGAGSLIPANKTYIQYLPVYHE